MPIIEITNNLRVTQVTAKQKQLIASHLTLSNPQYASAVRHGRSCWNIPKELSFYYQQGDDMLAPRGCFGSLWYFLGKPTFKDRTLVLPEVPLFFTGILRPYQKSAVQQMLSKQQGVLQATTGSGKTIMALDIIATRKQPTLVLVHNKELLAQWQERSKEFLKVQAGQIGAGKFQIQPLTIGIVNTVKKHLEELVPLFGQIVVDECHRCPSTMFTECVDAFPARFRLGLSATPFRRDGLTKVIGFYIGPKVHEINPAHLQNIGAVMRPQVIIRPTKFWDHRGQGDFYQELLTSLTENLARNQMIVADLVREAGQEQGTILVVSDRISHLEALKSLLPFGFTMDILTGQTPKKQREEIVHRVRFGQVKILGSTIQLIGEGFDCPGLTSLFMVTPIRFSGRLLQVVGRILRPQDGKTPRLFDYVDHTIPVLQASAKSRAKIYADQGYLQGEA